MATHARRKKTKTETRHCQNSYVGPTRYALYRRVSSPGQVEQGLSLPQQQDEQHEYVRQAGGVVVSEYEDGGISATTDERPEFQRMVADGLTGLFDVILIHRSNRAFRNYEDAVLYRASLKRVGVKMESVTESFVGSEEFGDRILTALQDLIDEKHSIDLSAEVHKGLTQMVKVGRQSGKPPYGYMWTSDKKGWMPDDAEASWVRWMYQAALEGWYYNRIVRHLNALGVPAPGVRDGALHTIWETMTVKRVLTNKRVTGQIHYRGAWHPGAHPAIIDEEDFERVQCILATRAYGRAAVSEGCRWDIIMCAGRKGRKLHSTGS